MTEAEWLASGDPLAMLRSQEREWEKGETYSLISSRKLRLFGAAVLRLGDRGAAPYADAAERFADDGDVEELRRVWGRLGRTPEGGVHPEYAAEWAAGLLDSKGRPPEAAALLREIVGNPFREVVYDRCWGIRNGGAVIALAHAAYDRRLDDGTLDPVRLAVLADALEEAGCPAEDVTTEEVEYCTALIMGCEEFDGMDGCTHKAKKAHVVRTPNPLIAHLRSPGPHVRGCWALDLFLGKE